MTITNNCEDMGSLPDEQSNFPHGTVHQVVYSVSKAYESRRGILQFFSCSCSLLNKGQAYATYNKLSRAANTRNSI